MLIRPYSAWRFSHPDLDTDATTPGLSIGPMGGVELIHEAASIRQSLILLLSTRPGERVMRPEYGSELHKVIFLPNDDTTAGLAIHYIRKAIRRWEPRAEIVKIDAERNADEANRIDISIKYRVRSLKNTGEVNFYLDLSP